MKDNFRIFGNKNSLRVSTKRDVYTLKKNLDCSREQNFENVKLRELSKVMCKVYHNFRIYFSIKRNCFKEFLIIGIFNPMHSGFL